MKLKVREVADLVGISVRTLHHYDNIGLLTPIDRTESGYRLYNESDIDMLQQILFFKALDFPLKKIKQIIKSPSFDQKEALQLHRNMLLEKQKRTDKMIATIDKTINHLEGEIQMSNKEKFIGFDFSENRYEKEARERWGDKVVDKVNDNLSHSSETEQEMNMIYIKLAKLKDESPASHQAQEAIEKWYNFLNSNTGHKYSLNAFKVLGQMYVQDERFTNNIDQFGEGLAMFMCESMRVYAENNK